ncbi:MAG: hypothetical protein U0103_28325, partial [Candidatus Obscuribacterales bacterium]
ALVTFLISSSLTYFSQSANFRSNRPGNDTSKQPESGATENANGGTNNTNANGTIADDTNRNGTSTNATSTNAPNTNATRTNDTSTTGSAANTSAERTGTAKATSETTSSAAASTEPTEYAALFANGVKEGSNYFHSKLATDDSLNIFKGYKLAQAVNLQDGQFSDKALQNLKDSKVLRLVLDNCVLDKFDNLADLSWLQVIDLTNSNVTDSAMPVLAHLKMLRHLQLKGCQISEDGLRQLATSNSLTFLDLTPEKYSTTFINELAEKMPGCIISPYKKNSKLQEIALSDHSKDRAQCLSKIIARAEKSNKYHSSNVTYLVELAHLYAKRGLFKDARGLVEKSVAICEHSGDLRSLVLPLRLKSGYVAVQDKDTEKAIALNDRAEHLYVDTIIHDGDPLMLNTLNEFTLLPLSLKQWDPAIEYCKTAIGFIDKYPKLDETHQMLPTFLERVGWLYWTEKKMDEAQPYLKRALDLNTVNKDSQPNPYLRSLIEYAHTLTKDFESRKKMYIEAIDQLDKLGRPEALDLNAHYLNACTNLALILGAQGDHTHAAYYFQKGLDTLQHFKHQEDMNKQKTMLSKGLVRQLAAAGRKSEAEKAAKKYGVKL